MTTPPKNWFLLAAGIILCGIICLPCSADISTMVVGGTDPAPTFASHGSMAHSGGRFNWTPHEGGMPNMTPPDGMKPNWTPPDGIKPNWTPSDGMKHNRTPRDGMMLNRTPIKGMLTGLTQLIETLT